MTKPFEIDMSKVDRLSEDLAKLHARGLPYAMRDTINRAAYAAKREWPEQMKKQFTLRSRWTVGSIRVERAQGLNPETMQSRVGSLAPFMETQEFGGTVLPKSGSHKATPTPTAAGESTQKKGPTSKVVRKANRLTAIHLDSKHVGHSRQQNAIAIKAAAKSGGVAFLDLGRRKGLFKVTGAGRRKRVRMLWDMSKPSVHLRARPTLEPTVKIVTAQGAQWASDALQHQIDSHLLHKGSKAGLVGFF